MKMKVLFIFFLVVTSCKSPEIIYSKEKLDLVQKNIIDEPKQFVKQDLNFLLNSFKSDYEDYVFYEKRNFILSGIIFSFKDSVSFIVTFDWKNSDFDFNDGVSILGKWDFEKLKKERIEGIEIRRKNKIIYSVGI